MHLSWGYDMKTIEGFIAIMLLSVAVYAQPCTDGACDSAVVKEIFEANSNYEHSIIIRTEWQNERLIKLDISNDTIKTLPASIGNLVELQYLWITLYVGDTIPVSIGRLLNLDALIIGARNVSELPKEIGNLTKLQRLYLENNSLSELPKEIGNLTNLQDLDFFGNLLFKLPKEIRNLTKLQDLYLFDNQLFE